MTLHITLHDLDGNDDIQGLETFASLRTEDLLGIAGGQKLSDPSGYLSSATNGGDSDPIRQ